MKYYSQHNTFNLFDLEGSLSGLNKDNRWIKLADRFPWAEAEREYNKLLKNQHKGAGNKPARLVIGAMIVKHIEGFSDEKTITAIQENPYMQYLCGLELFTDKPIFSSELFVHIRKRLTEDFFNKLTLMLQRATSSSDSDEHNGTLKMDATCCDAEVRFPTDTNLLEDGNKLLERLLDKFCAKNHLKKPSSRRSESRSAYILLIKKKHKGKKLIDKTKLIQLRCFQTDFVKFISYVAKFDSSFISCFTKRDIQWLEAAKTMYEQQKQMFDEKTHTCANRIISIYQSHIRPINRGKAKARTEFGAKIGASIIDGYTYIDHYSWNAYNESSDLKIHLENYRSRFGCLPAEVQADKIYLNKENRKLLQELGIKCYCRPLGRPPKEVDPKEASERLRAVGERNEVEATFGTSKRVYRANNIRAKLPDTAKVWIGACFFAKNIMKFLRELFALIFQICCFRSKISSLKLVMAQLYYNPVNVVNCGRILI